jgi:hypothetical protein
MDHTNCLQVAIKSIQFNSAHGPPSGPVDPALQVQLVKAALPAGELEFDGQGVHDAAVVCPVAVPYFPV